MKRYLVLIVVFLISCNSKLEQHFYDIKNEIDFASTLANCNKMVIE